MNPERTRLLALAGWLALAVFIVAGSAGTWSPYRPGVWAPTLVVAKDVVRNIALYIPFGALGMVALRRSDARGVARMVMVALVFSAANEAMQLYTIDRVASLTDIASAGFGTAAGAAPLAWRRGAR